MDNKVNGDDDLGIPDFLKRAETKAAAPVQSEVSQMTEAVETEVEAPKARKPRKATPKKATGKGNGASKPAKAAKAAPAKVKAASKAAKGKAKVKAKAPRAQNVPVDQFGFRVGSIKSQAAAMYASKRGATLAEVKTKLDSVQLNLLTKLETEGFKVSKVKEDGPGARQVTRYFLRAK